MSFPCKRESSLPHPTYGFRIKSGMTVRNQGFSDNLLHCGGHPSPPRQKCFLDFFFRGYLSLLKPLPARLEAEVKSPHIGFRGFGRYPCLNGRFGGLNLNRHLPAPEKRPQHDNIGREQIPCFFGKLIGIQCNHLPAMPFSFSRICSISGYTLFAHEYGRRNYLPDIENHHAGFGEIGNIP